MTQTNHDQVEQWINQRTFGRIHRLNVETVGDRVVVHGCASSYYVRQLALAALLEMFSADRVEMDVAVCKGTHA